jgi:hypothetical protein
MNGWDVTAQALDHRDTVGALTAALAEAVPSLAGLATEKLAETQAANLARVGLVLVPLTGGPLADLNHPADARLKEQAATSWFGQQQEGEQP